MQAKTIRKRELREMADEIATAIDARSGSAFIGTWLDRSGLSLDVRLTSKATGRRVVIHKWDDEDACSVRYIVGDFWRDPDNAREFAKQEDVAFTVEAIAAAARRMVEATREP